MKTSLEDYKKKVVAYLTEKEGLTGTEAKELVSKNEQDLAWYLAKGCSPQGMAAILVNPLY